MSDQDNQDNQEPELYLLLQKPTEEDLKNGPTGMLWYEKGHPEFKISIVYKSQVVPVAVVQQVPGMKWGSDGTQGQTFKPDETQIKSLEMDILHLEKTKEAAIENKDFNAVEIMDAKLRLAKSRYEQMIKLIGDENDNIPKKA
jgi:hypothetical protein